MEGIGGVITLKWCVLVQEEDGTCMSSLELITVSQYNNVWTE